VYEAQVQQAKAFLNGEITEPVEQLQQTMQGAAKNRHFERAATLREDMKAVKWLSHRADDIAQARERYTFVYQVAGSQDGVHSRQEVWYLVRRGIIEGAVAGPSNPAERRRTSKQLIEWLESDNRVGERFKPRPETLALVASWFRNNRGELQNTFLPGERREIRAKKRKTPTSACRSQTVKV
jgi:excinuclease ABC subunit C